MTKKSYDETIIDEHILNDPDCPKADPTTGMWEKKVGHTILEIDFVGLVEGMAAKMPDHLAKKLYAKLAASGYDIPAIKARRIT